MRLILETWRYLAFFFSFVNEENRDLDEKTSLSYEDLGKPTSFSTIDLRMNEEDVSNSCFSCCDGQTENSQLDRSLMYHILRVDAAHGREFYEQVTAWTAPSHYLNQCCDIVNWTLRNKLQWNFNWNSNIFIQENALENGVCKMVSILSRPQCVKHSCHDGPSKLRFIYFLIDRLDISIV